MATQLDISTLNLQDALDMALLIEKEAEERYLLFADQLGRRYRNDAADFFTMMARNEQRHGNEIAERRRLLFGDAPAHIEANMIGTDVEAPGFEKAVRYMSPRHALEVAMESEIKAYEFYDRILFIDRFMHDVLDPAVRKLIEALRDEEAEHQRLLHDMKAKYPDTMEPDFAPELSELPAL